MRAEPDTVKAFFRGIPIFGGLSEEGLDHVLALLEDRTVKAGTVMVRLGETDRNMYVVRSGEVIVRRPGPSGVMRKVVRLGPGEFFGETTLIEIFPSEVTVVVDADATLSILSNKALYALYQRDAGTYLIVVMNIARELSRRLRRAESRVCELAERTDDEDDRTQIARR